MNLQDYLSNLFDDLYMNYMILDQQFDFRKLIVITYLDKDVSINVSSKKNPWYCYECKGEGFWIKRLTTKPILDITIYNSDNELNFMSVFVFDIKRQKCKVSIFSYSSHFNSTIMHHNIVYNIKPIWKN
ncbi:MAG: hypothetical protein VZS44_08605 [Bacilli bacterium]|nr:hypothetical protein [Bacilli bacterium]